MNRCKMMHKTMIIYIFYIIFILFNEAINLLFYLINIKTNIYLSTLISFFLIVGIAIKVKNIIILPKKQLDIKHLFAVSIILSIGIIKAMKPDLSTDTINYHLVAQEPEFINFFNDGFGKGFFQIWGFKLGDKLFYFFRKLCGYRIGTILNSLVTLICYFQIHDLLTRLKYKYSIEHTSKFYHCLVSPKLWSLIIILNHDILMQQGLYFVDLLSIPIGLEIIRLLCFADNIEVNKYDIFYFALLNGILFAFKMTNIVYIIPAIIIYIYINKKQITFKLFILCFFSAMLPCLPYIIFNLVSTGNPVFPYYNTIFQSPFFKFINFKDTRWGPVGFWQTLFWPILVLAKSENRVSEIPDNYTIIYLISLVSLFLGGIKSMIKRNFKSKEIFKVVLFLFISVYIWALTTGYGRYYILGYLLLPIVLYYSILGCKKKKIYQVGIFLMLFPIVFGSFLQIKEVFQGREWSWRTVDKSSFEDNNYVFKDYKMLPYNISDKYNIDTFVLLNSTYSGFAHLIDPYKTVFNVYYTNLMTADSLLTKDYENKLQNALEGNSYDIWMRKLYDLENTISLANEKGVKIVSMNLLEDNLIADMLLVELKKLKINEVNILETTKDINLNYNGEKNLEFIAGSRIGTEGYRLQVLLETEEKVELVEEVIVDQRKINNYTIKIDSSNKRGTIHLKRLYSDGKLMNTDNNDLFILNANLE